MFFLCCHLLSLLRNVSRQHCIGLNEGEETQRSFPRYIKDTRLFQKTWVHQSRTMYPTPSRTLESENRFLWLLDFIYQKRTEITLNELLRSKDLCQITTSHHHEHHQIFIAVIHKDSWRWSLSWGKVLKTDNPLLSWSTHGISVTAPRPRPDKY